MAGWLLGWLGVWPVGWLAGWPIGSQTGLLADWLGWRLIISSMPFLFQCSISARSKYVSHVCFCMSLIMLK